MNLLLVDGSFLIHRYYHGYKNNLDLAVLMCVRKLNLFQNDYNARVMVAFDEGGSDYRTALLPSYKGNRKPREEDFETYRLKAIEAIGELYTVKLIRGVEADDIIATYCARLKDKHAIYILTGDKDLLQLVQEGVTVINPFTYAEVNVENFELLHIIKPHQMIEYLMLVGDAADNIPGVEGIGKQRASYLLKNHGSIENMLSLGKVALKPLEKTPGLLELNRKLITLLDDVDLGDSK